MFHVAQDRDIVRNTKQGNKHITNNKNTKRVIVTKNRRHEASNNETTYYAATNIQITEKICTAKKTRRISDSYIITLVQGNNSFLY